MERFELPEGTWSTDIRKWWDGLWRLPVSRLWTPDDKADLVRLARLYDDSREGLTTGQILWRVRQEIRLTDRFGLNPASQQRLTALRLVDDPEEDEDAPN